MITIPLPRCATPGCDDDPVWIEVQTGDEFEQRHELTPEGPELYYFESDEDGNEPTPKFLARVADESWASHDSFICENCGEWYGGSVDSPAPDGLLERLWETGVFYDYSPAQVEVRDARGDNATAATFIPTRELLTDADRQRLIDVIDAADPTLLADIAAYNATR